MKKLFLISFMIAGLARTALGANVAFAGTDIFGVNKNAAVTLTLLNQPLYYGQALAFGPPQSFCMTNYSVTVSNLIGGNWVMAVQGFPKLLVLAVPPNDTNTWNFTQLINSNTAYYAKLSTVFAYWPSNLDAWAALNPATALGGAGTATNLSGQATGQVQTLALQVADTNGAAQQAINSFYASATNGVFGFNLAASHGLPESGVNGLAGDLSARLLISTYNTGWGALATNIFSLYPLAATVVTNNQSGATLNNQTNTGTLYVQSITPSVQSGGNLNINLGSGTLIGNAVNVGGVTASSVIANGSFSDSTGTVPPATNLDTITARQAATALLTTPTVVTQIVTSIAYPNYGLRYEESGQGLGFLLFQQ